MSQYVSPRVWPFAAPFAATITGILERERERETETERERPHNLGPNDDSEAARRAARTRLGHALK